MRNLKALVGFIVGAVTGVLLSAVATPLLWKLEPILSLELAGHSGPSDNVILVAAILGAIVGVTLTWRATANQP